MRTLSVTTQPQRRRDPESNELQSNTTEENSPWKESKKSVFSCIILQFKFFLACFLPALLWGCIGCFSMDSRLRGNDGVAEYTSMSFPQRRESMLTLAKNLTRKNQNWIILSSRFLAGWFFLSRCNRLHFTAEWLNAGQDKVVSYTWVSGVCV